MNALPFNGDTVFRWSHGKEEVAARAIGSLDQGDHSRVVLMDTAERHWVAKISPEGKLLAIVSGPVDGAQALHSAMLVIQGIENHGSVTCLVNTLAVALVAQACNEARQA
jgi:hypothetical protein